MIRAFAPGRVNLIGDHTDYVGGLVLPMAIDLGTTVVGERGGDTIGLHSADEPDDARVPIGITADAVALVEPAWARYVAAVAVETGARSGFAGEVTTTLPIGAGLSSSAALEVAVALALGADASGDRRALAEHLRRAEHLASGVPCGVMDQLASLCAVEGHALLVDCTTLAVEAVPVPPGVEVVVVDSGVERRLAGVPYAERRREIVAASQGETGGVLARRARHLRTENERVRGVVAALRAGDAARAGALLTEGHRSLRDDAEVTVPAVDDLVERLLSEPGVLGARQTGGGWGGCVVALCDDGALPHIGWHLRPSSAATVELLA